VSFAPLSLLALVALLAWRENHDTQTWLLILVVGLMSWAAVFFQHRRHRQQQQVLQKRMGQRERAHQLLLQAQARQDQLFAAMSHELRTPMNAILGLHGVLRQHVATNPTHVARVDHLQQACAQMLRLINQSLDYARVLAHRLTLQPQAVALAPLLRSVAQEVAQQQPARVTLDLADVDARWVQADPHRLRQTVLCALEVCMGSDRRETAL